MEWFQRGFLKLCNTKVASYMGDQVLVCVWGGGGEFLQLLISMESIVKDKRPYALAVRMWLHTEQMFLPPETKRQLSQ